MKRLWLVLFITFCIFPALFISTSNAYDPGNPLIGLDVTLKSCYNNQYLSADSDRGNPPEICANRSKTQWWEEFQIVDAGNSYIALKSRNNGQFLRYVSPSTSIKADGGGIINIYNSWRLVKHSNGTFSFQNVASGLYAQVDPAYGTNPAKLYANGYDRNATNAQFYIGTFDVPYGCTVAFRSSINNKYWKEDNYGNICVLGTTGTSIYETFVIRDAGNGYIIMKALCNDRNLAVQGYGDVALKTRGGSGSQIYSQDLFQWINNGDGSISLLHPYSCTYLRGVYGTGSELVCGNSTKIGPQEKFYCEIR